MYHPSTPPVGSPWQDEDFEFIELQNVSQTVLDLRGLKFTRGVSFDFRSSGITNLPAGDPVLIVKNLAAFTARYGEGRLVAGQYEGQLDNAGEVLRLEDGVGEVVFEFSYSPLWQPQTDGEGRSLEIADASGRLSDSTSWRASAVLGGTPGLDNSAVLRIESVGMKDRALSLTFFANAGARYTLQHRSGFGAEAWQNMQPIAPPTQDGNLEISVSLPSGSVSRFYRLTSP
jgi:hypothetical protein